MMKPRYERQIIGASAILLPFDTNEQIDWSSFEAHLLRTTQAGLIPAVNMDTGYINFLSDAEQAEVLKRTQRVLAGHSSACPKLGGHSVRILAGAFVADQPGDKLAVDAILQKVAAIRACGGMPIIFPSHGFAAAPFAQLIELYQAIAKSGPLLAFELSQKFVPFGRIFSLDEFAEVLRIEGCVGLKHSSLSRAEELARLQVRDKVRPAFHLMSGNDLAIDMVMYGSDYLLGLSTFAPDWFARRDRAWLIGDFSFYTWNDWLQYVGMLAFRDPVPAYKHSMAQALHLRGLIQSDRPHPRNQLRPESDRPHLQLALAQLQLLEAETAKKRS